jgi:hypothetical protein
MIPNGWMNVRICLHANITSNRNSVNRVNWLRAEAQADRWSEEVTLLE